MNSDTVQLNGLYFDEPGQHDMNSNCAVDRIGFIYFTIHVVSAQPESP